MTIMTIYHELPQTGDEIILTVSGLKKNTFDPLFYSQWVFEENNLYLSHLPAYFEMFVRFFNPILKSKKFFPLKSGDEYRVAIVGLEKTNRRLEDGYLIIKVSVDILEKINSDGS